MNNDFPGRMLALAQNWRMGADELRAQFATGSEVRCVPFAVAACAGTIEACAQRLENEVADWYARQTAERYETQEPTNAS